MPNERLGDAARHGQGAFAGALGAAVAGGVRGTRRARLDQRALNQSVLARRDDGLAGRQTCQDDRLAVAFLTDRDGAHFDLVVAADDEGVETVRPAFDGARRARRSTCFSVSTSRRVETDRPGHRAPSAFSNVAFMPMAPLAGSIASLTTARWPCESVLNPSELRAVTGVTPAASALLICGTSSSGAVNTTEIGCNWTIVTMPVVSTACTMLPASTRRKPVLPVSGERIVV